VYPKTGRKRAEVEAQDLDRLADSEFLNDNLIGFYIRFLEHHLERTSPHDLAKRVYFFNSYFFASLTNKPRGVKGINYASVEKWTRAVDLFQFDYIVVPINESAHWYVAIICNLPSLIRSVTEPQTDGALNETTAVDDDEDESVLHVEQPSADEPSEVPREPPVEVPESPKAEGIGRSLRQMTLSDRSASSSPSPAHKEPVEMRKRETSETRDWPDADENQPSSPVPLKSPGRVEAKTAELARESGENPEQPEQKAPPSKKKGQKARPPVQRHDPAQPIIVTFDSLGCKRSPTIKILRDYLEEEAKSKRDLSLDTKLIKGMTAQQIPLQPNFSDCGLYLLAYLEMFIRDPDLFVKKLLRKEMHKSADWPRLRSGELRRRLRDFLLALYDEQNSDKDGAKGGEQLLVDSKPLQILLVDDKNVPGDGESSKAPSPTRAEGSRTPAALRLTEIDRRTPEPVSLVQQPRTPVRSSPRLSRKEGRENMQHSSPSTAVAVSEPAPVDNWAGNELLSQLRNAAGADNPELPAPVDDGVVPETPPPPLHPPSTRGKSPEVVIPSEQSRKLFAKFGF
jgi:hypothetical protein